jgi:hypothetical protein
LRKVERARESLNRTTEGMIEFQIKQLQIEK